MKRRRVRAGKLRRRDLLAALSVMSYQVLVRPLNQPEIFRVLPHRRVCHDRLVPVSIRHFLSILPGKR